MVGLEVGGAVLVCTCLGRVKHLCVVGTWWDLRWEGLCFVCTCLGRVKYLCGVQKGGKRARVH